tara:strand:- start:920 stop:1132 length:213 start_codon:yes stop_codon:yes gene_type:complete
MRPDHIEQILDDVAYKVTWGDYKPKYEFLAEYVPGTMLDPQWNALEMFQFEIMAMTVRKQYGFDTSTEED